jgi:hypothetical protein
MSFLFKSKKSQNPNALPNATRGIHTSEGTSSPPANVPINGFRDRDRDRDPEKLPGILPGGPMAAAPPGSPRLRRDRADSEPQVQVLFIQSRFDSVLYAILSSRRALPKRNSI